MILVAKVRFISYHGRMSETSTTGTVQANTPAAEIHVFTLNYDGRFEESRPFASAEAASDYALKRLAEALGIELSGDAASDWREVREEYDRDGCAYEYDITASPLYADAASCILKNWSEVERAKVGL